MLIISIEDGNRTLPNHEYCNTIDLMGGFLFYSDENQTLADIKLSQLIKKRTYIETNHAAYSISYAAASYGYTNESFVSKAWREKAYKFCKFEGGSCSIVLFNSFDEKYSYVNNYLHQVPYGACADTFTSDNWYMKCAC